MRVGFLGAGLIATYHSKSLRRSGAELAHGVVRAGVYDPNRTRADLFAAASGHTVCETEDQVLDSCDAVYVCTWTSEHQRQVAKAAQRGLAVFCEKPLATTFAAAGQMANQVSQAAIINQVGLVLRHSPAYLWAAELIAVPAAGRVMSVVFRDDQFIPVQGHYGSTWRANRELAGAGTLLEHSIHDIDMCRFLIGDIAQVSAQEANFHGHDGIEDVVAATLRFANGALGTLTTVWHDNLARPSLRRVEVFCERRYIAIEGDDWFGPVSWTDSDGTEQALQGDALASAALGLVEGSLNPDGEFIASVAQERSAFPDFATALHAHAVVQAIYDSAAQGGVPQSPLTL